MYKHLFIILIFCTVISGCKKTDIRITSGTETLESTLYGTGPYYAYGFSFSSAKKVTTISSPVPDITVNASRIDGKVSIETSSYLPPFSLIGEYGTEAEAKQAFANYLIVADPQWISIAKPLKNNQLWLFKTSSGNYVKIRIILVLEEVRQDLPYGSCTFEWVYQPDGSASFPSK
jgi:hypothetical protein